METVKIFDIARRLKQSHGDKALLEAAQKAVAFERDGNASEAQNSRRIEDALRQMSGPHQS